VEEIAQKCIADGGEYRDEYRIVDPAGGVRWVSARGQAVIADADGERRLTLTGIAWEVGGGAAVPWGGGPAGLVLALAMPGSAGSGRDW
jgi:hypothetical protein